MKIRKAFFAALCIAALGFGSCFSSWNGETGEGTISINLGNSGARSAVTEEMKAAMVYAITLTSATAEIVEGPFTAFDRVTIAVLPGIWNVTVTAYLSEMDRQDDNPFAEGKAEVPVTVRAGENSPVSITMKLIDGDDTEVISVETWAEVLGAIANAADKKKSIVITAGELTAYETALIDNNSNIILRANTAVTITKADGFADSLFAVIGGSLELDGAITIKGNNAANNKSLIAVSGGSLTMYEGVTLTGNTVDGDMPGSGEDIPEFNSSFCGGGVFISGGTFTMIGGIISGNTAPLGGGVMVETGAAFNMAGGIISGNEALFGGGVLIGFMETGEAGTFNKTGGTIYGSDEFDGNRAAEDANGHAVYAVAIKIGGINFDDINDINNININDINNIDINGADNFEPVVRFRDTTVRENETLSCVYNNGNVVFSGKWDDFSTEPQPATFIVTFNSNGGTPVESRYVVEGGAAEQPDDPHLSGYTFDNWYSDEGLTTVYDFSAPVTGDITLYAKWIQNPANTFTVTFSSNGGTHVPGQPVELGNTAPRPNDPTRAGYSFVGWYSDAGLTAVYDFFTPVTDDITLYAKWDAIIYTVTFNSNEGSDVATQTVNSGDTATRPAHPTRNGYTFDNWYSDEGLTAAYDFSAPVTGDITLYANWNLLPPGSYTVMFDTNGGSDIADLAVESGAVAARPAHPTRSGYTFDNWYRNSDLTELYDFSTLVTDNITLYAKWNIITHTVTFNSNGGSSVVAQTVNSGIVATLPANPTRDGYTFDNWYRNSGLTTVYDFSTPVTGNITLYAKWTINTYTVTFNADGGEPAPAQQTVNYGDKVVEPAAMTKTGYTFENWYSNEGLTAVYDFATPVTGNITLFAKWDEKSGSITITIGTDKLEVELKDDNGKSIPIILDSSEIEESDVEITISRSAEDTYRIILTNPGGYEGIKWEVPGVVEGKSVTKTGGDDFTLDATDTIYNSIGMHVLYLELKWKGKPYLIKIPFEVVN